MSEIGLADLCKRLFENGYTHAAFVTKESLTICWNTPDLEPGIGVEPSAICFSKLDFDEIDAECVPEWYSWIEANDYEVDSYGQRDIIFIKVRGQHADVIDDSDRAFTDKRYASGTDVAGRTVTNWNSIRAARYRGAVIDDPHAECWGRNASWDVATAVIWDKECTLLKTDAIVFKASGNSFEYENEPLSIEEYMAADETRTRDLASALQILHERLIRLIN